MEYATHAIWLLPETDRDLLNVWTCCLSVCCSHAKGLSSVWSVIERQLDIILKH